MPEYDPQQVRLQITAEVVLPPEEVLGKQQRIVDVLRAVGVPKIEFTTAESDESVAEELLMPVDVALDGVEYPRTRQHQAVRQALSEQGAHTLRELLAFGKGMVSCMDNVGPRTMPYLAKALESELPDIPWRDQPTPADVAELYGRVENVPSLVLGRYDAVPGWSMSRLATADIQEIIEAKRHDITILNRERHAIKQRESARRFMEAFHAAKAARG